MDVLTKELDKNALYIQKIFKNSEMIIARFIENQINSSMRCCLIYMDGMVNNQLMNDNVLKPIIEYPYKIRESDPDYISIIAQKIILANGVEITADPEKIAQAVVYGDCILLADGCDKVLILNTKGWATRSPSEPENEKVMRGPREGFNESLMVNLSMLRRRLRTRELRMEFDSYGTRSKTKGCICYIDNLVNKKILWELKRRLKKFSMDGAIDSNYILEYIRDEPYSPFKTIGGTERPDIVAAKLLEGRIAFFLDGTPVVLTLPYLFIENFQSNDDYYLNFYYASISRLIRILSFFISISIPAIYVGLTTFHHEMLPSNLIGSISMARNGVPLPTVVEAILMMIVFEILRETGLRTPQGIGQALSIVGALVIGQAAVDARLISAPMIIIISLAGITGIMLPKVKGAIILLRFGLLILASIIGLYGYTLGILSLIMHLFTLRSFGIPVVGGQEYGVLLAEKDMFVRAPWWTMIKRPMFMSTDKRRSNSDGDPE